MIKIALCDDEQQCIKVLGKNIVKYLKDRTILYELHMYNSGKKLLELQDDILHYDVIFLDINMDEVDGIETAKKIRQYSEKIQIVFVTAFIDYSLEGYKVNAVRYLLKDDIHFQQQVYECMDEIIARMNYTVIKKEFSFVGGTIELSLDNIVYIESCAHKLQFYVIGCEKKEYSMYSKLGTMEELLKEHHFIRIHQSYLVNYKYIESMNESSIYLSVWNKELMISRERYANARKMYILLRGDL